MTIEQTVEIPASHRLVIDVPREVPAGRVVLAFTPAGETKTGGTETPTAGGAPAPHRAQRLLGACAGLADMSLEEIRDERLGKYL